ncbi:hypothetical protein [Streptomyces sp. Isolate_45]|uniref:hypothetical protein n=1 Tax=Streptomyces sp. Isolate_45 TaxID=2950111 RepID=UPI002481E294|nr:hypothetical protein [Streptomyces sp. Isolate_45]MDA5283701.1 hypothetical protein [Streptomyces sp. Isolate_45]
MPTDTGPAASTGHPPRRFGLAPVPSAPALDPVSADRSLNRAARRAAAARRSALHRPLHRLWSGRWQGWPHMAAVLAMLCARGARGAWAARWAPGVVLADWPGGAGTPATVVLRALGLMAGPAPWHIPLPARRSTRARAAGTAWCPAAAPCSPHGP